MFVALHAAKKRTCNNKYENGWSVKLFWESSWKFFVVRESVLKKHLLWSVFVSMHYVAKKSNFSFSLCYHSSLFQCSFLMYVRNLVIISFMFLRIGISGLFVRQKGIINAKCFVRIVVELLLSEEIFTFLRRINDRQESFMYTRKNWITTVKHEYDKIGSETNERF